VPGVVPLEVTDDLPGELRRLTDHHEPGRMVEQGVELLAMLDWSRASLDNVSVRAKRGRGLVPPAGQESAATPVRVGVSTVVVTSANRQARDQGGQRQRQQ
jgi:hypothetical protein